MRALPFERLGLGLEVREPERRAVVVARSPAGSPSARRRGRAPWRAPRRASRGPCRRGPSRLLPALQAMRAAGLERQRVDPGPPVAASSRVEPSRPVTATRPSSPPVTSRSPSLAATRIAPSGMRRDAVRSRRPSRARRRRRRARRRAVSPSQAAAVTCAPASMRRDVLGERGGEFGRRIIAHVVAGSEHAAPRRSLASAPRRPAMTALDAQSPSLVRGCGR